VSEPNDLTQPVADGSTDPGGAAGDANGPAPAANGNGAAERVELDIEALMAERGEFLDRLMRLQADYENYRKRVAKNQADEVARATARLVEDLLPALDACELAYAHGVEGIEGVWSTLLGALRKAGLEPMDPTGKPFDPAEHEAVVHEPGDGTEDGQSVIEVFRTGYTWSGRVLRPAMVKVKG